MFALVLFVTSIQPGYLNVILDIDYGAAEAFNADKSKDNEFTNETENISLNYTKTSRQKKMINGIPL